MSNFFGEVGKKLNTMILIIWPVALLGVFGSGYIMYMDYMSTVYAYDQLPTYDVDAQYAGYVVAFMLATCQIVFFYMYMQDTNKVWANRIAGACAGVDIFTDVWFKMGGHWDWVLLPWAILLSITVYTFVSEVLFTTLVGFCAETFGDFLAAFAVFLDRLIDGFMQLAGLGTGRSASRMSPGPQMDMAEINAMHMAGMADPGMSGMPGMPGMGRQGKHRNR